METLKCNSDHIKTMKKLRYIFFALAAIITASCSKHNTDGPQPLNSYIFFDAGMSDIVETKTERIPVDVFQNDGTAFGVLGFYQNNAPIFNGYRNNIAYVYREDGLYKYDDLAVWQGSTHRFSAFYPYGELLESVKVADNVPYIEYTQPWNMAAMKDILGAYTEVENANPTSTNEPVKFRFQHLLWKFNVVIKNSQTLEVNPEDEIIDTYLAIKEVSISLQDFPSTANLNLDKDFTVTPVTKSPNSCILYSAETEAEGVIETDQTKTFGPLLFIPVPTLKYQVTVEYVITGGETVTYTYPSAGQYQTLSTPLEHGKVYNITIDKKNDKFFVGIEPGSWDQIDVEHTFD